jgi:hypothetical protein
MQQSITGNPDGSITMGGLLDSSTINWGGTSTSSVTFNMYSRGASVEVGREYFSDRMVLIYKQEKRYMVSNNWGTPPSETIVYKEVHTFGPNGYNITRVDGVYIPPQEESYEFED